MKFRLILLMILLAGVATISFAQVISGDYRSKATGNWNDYTKWQVYTTGWNDATNGQIPGANNNVYIQNGHAITLTQPEACNDLNINTATGSRVALANYTLSLNGKLRGFSGAINTLPGTDAVPANVVPITCSSSSGILKVVGSTRNLTNIGQWGEGTYPGSTSLFHIEIAPDTGATLSMQTYIRAQSWNIISGALDIGNNSVMADNGSSARGNVTVGAAATVVNSNIGISSMFKGGGATRGGTLNMNGTLKILTLASSGTAKIAMTTLNFNGTVEYAANGAQNTLGTGGDGSASPTTFNNVILSGSGTKTLANNTTINGKLTVKSTATLALSTYTRTYGVNSTLEYTGTSPQTTANSEWPPTSGPQNVIINNSNSVTLNGAKTIAGNLTLSSGTFAMGTYAMNVQGTTYESGGYYTGGTGYTDGYNAVAKYINIAANDVNMYDFSLAMTTPTPTLLPQYVNRKWSISGTYTGGSKTVTFYWTNADDNNFYWNGIIPAVWNGTTRYLASSYDVTGATRYIIVSIPAFLTTGDYVIGQEAGDGTLPGIRIYIQSPTYHTSTDDITIPVMIDGLDQNIRGFSINFNFNPSYLDVHNLDDFREGTFLSSNGLTQWYVTGSNGLYNITCSLLGVSIGSIHDGTLFTVTLTPQGMSTGAEGTDVILSDIVLRDPLNHEVYVSRIENSNVVIDVTPVYANFTVFLQGPYINGGSMTHSLGTNIPLVSPYDSQVISSLPNVLPNYIVDWVYVQLRTGTASNTTVQSANAFLLQNGALVDVLGNSSLPFFQTAGNQYYIVIKHRNHLAIMSSVRYSLSNNPTTPTIINLSASGSIYGPGNLGFKLVETGVYALIAGDADGNGVVEPIDSNNFWRVQTGLGGYLKADFNIDGQVQPIDKNNFWRLNTGLQSQVP